MVCDDAGEGVAEASQVSGEGVGLPGREGGEGQAAARSAVKDGADLTS